MEAAERSIENGEMKFHNRIYDPNINVFPFYGFNLVLLLLFVYCIYTAIDELYTKHYISIHAENS